MTDNAWSRLALFESTDLVHQCYKALHGRDLSRKKARAITAYAQQGRERFAIATATATIVRPVLLYYGTLALARGAVLFRTPHLSEDSLSESHGLSPVDWTRALSKGVAGLPDLAIRIEQKGTFSSLAVSTRNGEQVAIFRKPHPIHIEEGVDPERLSHDQWHVGGTASFSDQPIVTFRDLLGRLPDLAELYRITFQDDPPCRRVVVVLEGLQDVAARRVL